jgi:hypothetical protein
MKSVIFLLCAIALGLSSVSFAQEQDENGHAKAEALIRAAIKARGGDTYVNVRSVISRGQHTPFLKGVSGDPSSFVDYIAYPDRERTEFGKGDRKYIQTNSLNSGWIYDGAQKMIRDQTEEQPAAQQMERAGNAACLYWPTRGLEEYFLRSNSNQSAGRLINYNTLQPARSSAADG